MHPSVRASPSRPLSTSGEFGFFLRDEIRPNDLGGIGFACSAAGRMRNRFDGIAWQAGLDRCEPASGILEGPALLRYNAMIIELREARPIVDWSGMKWQVNVVVSC